MTIVGILSSSKTSILPEPSCVVVILEVDSPENDAEPSPIYPFLVKDSAPDPLTSTVTSVRMFLVIACLATPKKSKIATFSYVIVLDSDALFHVKNDPVPTVTLVLGVSAAPNTCTTP